MSPVAVPCSWNAPSQAHIALQAKRTVVSITPLLCGERSPL